MAICTQPVITSAVQHGPGEVAGLLMNAIRKIASACIGDRSARDPGS